jgi:hypothetical protein
LPTNICVECGGPHWRFIASRKGTCSARCWEERANRAQRRFYMERETARRLVMQQNTTEPRRLLRDLDGYIHTPSGFVSARRYDDLRAKFPERQFPERESIPLMNELSDDDLASWYGSAVPHEVLMLRAPK